MKQRDRLRRALILCCHCLRNIAFYRSWNKAGKPFAKQPFWAYTNGNFLDIAVLEWCKLFADVRGQHFYTKVLLNSAEFKVSLITALGLLETEFDDYVKSMRTYRDKFVAHLDDSLTMEIPNLDVAKNSATYLYQCLHAQESGNDTFHDAPPSASGLYKESRAEGVSAYARAI